jgi:ABC-type lipoprotein export system ATPase subunit
MIGVSGSGKTTWVNLNKQYTACSTDSILEEKAQKMGISYTEAFDYFQDKKNSNQLLQHFFKVYVNVLKMIKISL